MRYPYDLDDFFQVDDQSMTFLYHKCKEVLGEEIAEKIRLFGVSPKNQPKHNCDIQEHYNDFKRKVKELIPLTYWQAYKAIMHDVNTGYGAPMGRPNVGTPPVTVTRFSGRNVRTCKCDQVKVYERRVPMIDGAYDSGGAYWGIGKPLYVRFTKDLSYIEFFRA